VVARVVAAVALLVVLALPGAARAQGGPVVVDAGDGVTVRVERSPFRVSVVERDGREAVATVPGAPGAPVRPPGVDGPQPAEPLGAAGGFPALGWVVGARAGVTYPLPFFTGNRLFGAEAGGVVAVTGVSAARAVPGGADLALTTGAGPAAATVRTLPGGGAALRVRPPDGLAGIVSTVFTLASPRDEGLYGLGARKDAFDQRGRLRNVWTEQQNATDERAEPAACAALGCDYTFPNGAQAAYYVQAALHGSRGWAAWVDRTELSRVDLAASRADAVRWAVAAPELTLHLAGGGVERASAAYTAAAGRAPAPPRYAYEPWIDVINEGEGEAAPNGSGFSGGARVKAELETIVAETRRHDLPVGVLGVEGWHRVPEGEAFFAALRRAGLRLSAYWNPFTSPGTPAYDEAVREGVFVRDASGRPYEFVNNRGGRVSVIDFSHPRALAFWRRQLDRSKALGFEAFMHDFGEFVTEGMRFASGNPPEVEHNAYPVRFHAAARAALDAQAREDPGFAPFFYVRSGFTGVSGSTPSVFPGDETTDWSQGSGLPSVVPAMLNLALAGSYAFTTDVGGYFDLTTPRMTPELFTRWNQLASLTPVSRIHNSTFSKSVYPWELGPEALDAYRRYGRLKRRLIPLVDAWARRASTDGAVGPVRPLLLDDPSPAARSVDDAWLLGRDLLVAPVLEPGARGRAVYLPAGAAWEPVRVGADGALVAAGAPLPGGRSVTVPVTLADIPLFRRAGTDPDGSRARADPDAGAGAPAAAVPAPARAPGPSAPRCRTPRTAFRSVAARPLSRGRLRLTFARRVPGGRVRIDVFRQSAGRRVLGERRVLLAGRARTVRRLRGDGIHLVRFALRGDVRRLVVERRRGRWRARPLHERRDGCGRIARFKLERPVFGGTTARPLGIALRLGGAAPARVRVAVRARGRAARTLVRRTLRPGTTHRFRLRAAGVPRGDVRIRVLVPGARPATLTARRL